MCDDDELREITRREREERDRGFKTFIDRLAVTPEALAICVLVLIVVPIAALYVCWR